MIRLDSDSRGFSLIELIVVILVLGIVAATAMKSMTASVDDMRRSGTEREMEMLTKAIVGDPAMIQNGGRVDFGYVGDIGAFPSNLQALYQNPGGYSTWHGPYLPPGFDQDSTGFKLDEWGQPYAYSGGITITSSGGGTAMTKKISDAGSDYLLNKVYGTIKDANDSMPGASRKDFIDIKVDMPSGPSGLITKTYHPDAAGGFMCDSLPAGSRYFRFIYATATDTVPRYFTVLPRHRSSRTLDVKFAMPYFSTSDSGLVAHWKLDETSGTTASDASGNGHNGTLSNMDPATDWVTGRVAGGLDFDGVNDYVNIGNSFSPNGAITVCAWVKPSSNGVDRQIVSKGFDGTKTQWELKTTSAGGLVSFRHWAPGAVGVQSIHTLVPGVWTHLTGTYDGATWKIYWNGVLDNQNAASGQVPTTKNLYIGAVDINGTPGQFWRGVIDDVRIYNRALAAAEIAALAH